MGASSSGLLDEAKISHIKGLVDSMFQSFSVFYQQQYAVAYFGHLHQELEPKKERRGLLLTHRPQYAPEEVLYQGSVKFSCWDEHGKKSRERHVVLRRDYRVEIHDNMETFNRGCAAKLVLQPAGGSVFTTDAESRAHLEKTCAGILNGVKEDSPPVDSSPDVFAVYLHLPHTGHTCFLFQQEEERDHFLFSLQTCIRHRNLDPWCDSSHESQAFARALRLYRQDKGCYESWEKLLGTEEQVLASQAMEEVLPWLQSQLQSKVKGKKTERIRLWLATVQATYTLVLEQLTADLEAMREECRQTASANQTLIRSNLDQIMSSHRFLEQKVRACTCEEAEKACSESVSPYLSSILQALTENISVAIVGMQHTLHTQMSSAFSHTNGGTEDTKTALSILLSIRLDECYRQVEQLAGKLEDLQQRFGISSTQRLVHSAHLEMEQLLDSAVYTLEQYLRSSARLQPAQLPVKMERARERVVKQLDYDSRVVQRRLYEEALLEITLPSLSRRMDSSWRTELQQFEQFIFSDYGSFIVVRNVYEDVLRNILRKEIERVVQDTASKKSNNVLLDISDLAISQYSLLGQTPPRSAPGSPAAHAQRSSSTVPCDQKQTAPVVEERSQTGDVGPQRDPELTADTKQDPGTTQSSDPSTALLSPEIVVTQQLDDSGNKEAPWFEETREEVQIRTTAAESSNSDVAVEDEGGAPDPPADSTNTDAADPSPLVSPQSADVQAGCDQSENPALPDLRSVSDQISEEVSPGTDGQVKLSLGSLSDAIGCSSSEPSVMHTAVQQTTDRAVYLTGEIKDNWEIERLKEQKHKEAAEKEGDETIKERREETEGTEEEMEEEERVKEQMDGEAQTGGEQIDEGCRSCASPAEGADASNKKQSESQETDTDLKTETRKEEEKEEAEEKGDDAGEEEKGRDEDLPRPIGSQPQTAAELPLDSVALIRELVTEVTEVQTVVTPVPTAAVHPDIMLP
ncbi:LOW QUALITY PROTEIN: protein Niban 1-like [Embiotoca jacksoni]|uniref:LOW QUALITY PROTEIN: protein Niban 1-like n=1 Tax=Embiotoca jacksoni TaxID=100190 RepID=UPI0037042B68